MLLDLRHGSLEEQALAAIRSHAKSTTEPTSSQLATIAGFQETHERFFTSAALRAFATGTGPRPQLPAAQTASETRGRVFFEEGPLVGKQAACAACHSGPMLNEVSSFAVGVVQLPAGAKFANVLVAETNALLNPTFGFLVDNGSGVVRTVVLPDPGILLTGRETAHLNAFLPGGRHPADFGGFFKTPSLWGIKNTSPYFHDNSAKTLRAVVDHYADIFFPTIGLILTEQDRQDIVAFLERL